MKSSFWETEAQLTDQLLNKKEIPDTKCIWDFSICLIGARGGT